MTQNKGECRSEPFTKGHVRSSASFPGSQGKVYIILNIGCLDWDYPESNMLLLIVKTDAQRREPLSLFRLEADACPAACGL